MKWELFAILFLVVLFFYLIYSYQNQSLTLRFKDRNSKKTSPKVFEKSQFSDVLFVISFNSPLYHHIPLLEKAYKDVFPSVIYCGPTYSESIYQIEKKITTNGFFSYDECAAYAMRSYPNYTGYFTMSDDVLLNAWNLKNLSLAKIWEGTQMPYRSANFSFSSIEDGWLGRENGYGLKNCVTALQKINALKKYAKFLKNLMETKNTFSSGLIKKSLGGFPCYAEQSDIFYVPRRMADYFV